MKLLANENFPRDAVAEVRAGGHDVAWVREIAPGMKDEEVLAWAVREERVLVTFDKDFGELAYKLSMPATCGIILFRIPMPSPVSVGAILAACLAERNDWADTIGPDTSQSLNQDVCECVNCQSEDGAPI